MNLKTIFRIAVITEWVLIVLALVARVVFRQDLPPLAQQYEAERQARDLTVHETVCLWGASLLLPVSIASSVGLLFFKRWARPLYFAVSLIFPILLLYEGPALAVPISTVIDKLSLIDSGFIIGVMWFSALASEFKRASPSSSQRAD